MSVIAIGWMTIPCVKARSFMKIRSVPAIVNLRNAHVRCTVAAKERILWIVALGIAGFMTGLAIKAGLMYFGTP